MYNNENTKEVEKILARISAELGRQGKTQAELMKYLSLPAGTYNVWKASQSRNFCEHLGAIAFFLGIDTGWLATGTVKGDSVDEREADLLDNYRKLNREKQETVLKIMSWLAE